MYTYEYERIHIYTGRSQFINSKNETTGHREIVTRRAREGWRYMGVIPIAQTASGVIVEMDLVFEKEV